jgi:hypothetical protein
VLSAISRTPLLLPLPLRLLLLLEHLLLPGFFVLVSAVAYPATRYTPTPTFLQADALILSCLMRGQKLATTLSLAVSSYVTVEVRPHQRVIRYPPPPLLPLTHPS